MMIYKHKNTSIFVILIFQICEIVNFFVFQICGSCTKSSSSIDCCVSLDCPMLFKMNTAKRDLSQAPYLRKILANELF